MTGQHDTGGSGPRSPAPKPDAPPLAERLAALATNALAGAVASLLTLGYCLSFSALLFQGELAAGFPAGLWAFLVGSAIAGLYVSLATTLPPAEAGPDNPAVAVLSVLAAQVAGAVLAAGGSRETAIEATLLAFSAATLVTGVALYAIGALRLGQVVRFTPYPVIGGFLAASGWFLVVGGIEVVTGRDLTLATLASAVPQDSLPKLALAVLFAAVVFAVRRLTGSFYVLPLAILGGSIVLDAILWWRGAFGPASGWFMPVAGALEPWVPVAVLHDGDVDWHVILGAAAEIGAVAGVTVIALLLDITGLEVARTKAADIDHEFRINGIANIVAAPAGGIMGNLSMNGSRLLDETGGLARVSGVFASLVVVAVVVTGVDLPGLVPTPILAGLLMYLGAAVLNEVLLRSPAHRAWTDFALALLIMAAIVIAGYLTGILFGLIAACLLFAVSYSRVPVIRRHLTRATVASNVDRAEATARLLETEGDRIHVFWLAGYIFFGSSNGVFETIRRELAAHDGSRHRFVVLDLSAVTGFDTSALLAFVKLRNFADDHAVALTFAGAPPSLIAALERLQITGTERPHRTFALRDAALAWCESELLAREQSHLDDDAVGALVDWLATELGGADIAERLARWFVPSDVAAGTVLYREGMPSDTIDLLAQGSLAVTVAGRESAGLLVRRMATRTVIGEMGFFRGTPRTATVTVEAPTRLYTLDRATYARLRAEDPGLATEFLEFVVRTLSSRLAFANRGIAALD